MRSFLSRREILRFAGAAGFAGIAPLSASDSGFWNKKDPADWTAAEIDQLTNKSPWAKEITVTAPAQGYGGGYPGGGDYPGGGYPGGGYPGGGYPGGIGFPGGMGRRRGPGIPAGQVYKAVVRWQSAKVILDAMKTPLPEKMTNHYVIVVGGIPVNPRDNRYGSNDDSGQSNQDILDRMKSITFLQPKNKRDLQPGVIVQQPANYGDVYFGFARDLVTLRPEDKEVVFSTSFGRIPVKVKFNLKEMMYRGELSV
ncbi:MAG TPA: hypothetical protein VKX39_06260 [Bryobacteraceae bacterium]|jgi:hypothetical protein|nr:hypothetical protein [Bryobacteraceae bacterium]